MQREIEAFEAIENVQKRELTERDPAIIINKRVFLQQCCGISIDLTVTMASVVRYAVRKALLQLSLQLGVLCEE